MTLHKADDKQPEGTLFIRVHKQREDAKPGPMAFQIKGFEIGQNRHGEISTVPWAVPFRAQSSLIEEKRPKASSDAGPSLSARRAKDLLRVLTELHRQNSSKWHKPKDVAKMSGEPFNGIRDNPDTLRKKVRAALDVLREEDKIEECSEGVRLRSVEDKTADQGSLCLID
jgi:hypothetical protein